MKVEFEGKKYDLPEGLSQDEISGILLGPTPSQADVRKMEPSSSDFPVISKEEQAERDERASQIRLKEVKGNMKEVSRAIDDLKKQLRSRALNGDVRKMLKRELAYWEALQEKKDED